MKSLRLRVKDEARAVFVRQLKLCVWIARARETVEHRRGEGLGLGLVGG